MGKPGQFHDQDVKEVIKQYEVIAKKYNKLIGYHVVPIDNKLVEEKIDQGYNFIAYSFDAFFLGTMCRNQLKDLKR
jgi:2-dehydro-3-deoxyglucarate aldolase